jgi:DNA-binding MarR family transcriptional regulator
MGIVAPVPADCGFADEMASKCFANRLRTASRAISRHYDAALKPLDLKVSQMSVLAAARLGQGALTIVELAARLGMDRSTLSRNLDPLERRGLVEIGPEARHRARRVALTAAGAALLEEAYPLWQAAQAAVAGKIADMRETADRLDPIIEHFG